jgi:hypothetical protein
MCFLVAVAVDGPLGSQGNQLYQIMVTFMIATSMISCILGPIAFDSIVAMGFNRSSTLSPTKPVGLSVSQTQDPATAQIKK